MADTDRAKHLRDQAIERLQVCDCDYPVTRYRSGSGHRPGCPAHALWGEQVGIAQPAAADG